MKKAMFSGQIPQNMVDKDFEFHHYCTPFEPIPLHFHDFYEVYTLLSDSVTFLVEGRYYRLTPGDILLISPNQMHSVLAVEDITRPYERIDLYFRPEFFAKHSTADYDLLACFESSGRAGEGHLIRPYPARLKELRAVLQALRKQMDCAAFGGPLLRETLAVQLLVQLNRASLEYRQQADKVSSRATRSPVDEAIRLINTRFSQPLTLDLLARSVGVSKYHLVRLFRQRTGLTPIQYVRYRRLLHARTLLQGGRRVADVAHACGFTDYSNFIRAFRQEFGQPPGQFARDQHPAPFESRLLIS